jgi:hypothetical protein
MVITVTLFSNLGEDAQRKFFTGPSA